MKALVQRVRSARVEVDGEVIGEIGTGVLVLLGVERRDDERGARALAKKVAGYRLFSDQQGKMNLDLLSTGGEALVVSQFTLAADTRKGRRPGFSEAAPPDTGRALYECFVEALASLGVPVATGRFGADMQVHLINDGPVTFLLET